VNVLSPEIVYVSAVDAVTKAADNTVVSLLWQAYNSLTGSKATARYQKELV
jgi:hypothetical protein